MIYCIHISYSFSPEEWEKQNIPVSGFVNPSSCEGFRCQTISDAQVPYKNLPYYLGQESGYSLVPLLSFGPSFWSCCFVFPSRDFYAFTEEDARFLCQSIAVRIKQDFVNYLRQLDWPNCLLSSTVAFCAFAGAGELKAAWFTPWTDMALDFKIPIPSKKSE